MLYQGIIGGGSSPVEDLSPVLLWTNPGQGNTFAAQTINLDLTDYAGVLIESITDGIGSTTYVKKNETHACGTLGSETGGGVARAATVSETNVVFGEAYALNTVTNTAARPVKIYGVKEYVVEPVSPITKDLLWTNQSPTSDFGTFGQTNYIDADLTNYEYVLIEYYQSTTNTATSFFMNKVSDLPLSTNGNQNGLGSSGSGYGICRPVSKNSSNKLGFEGAFAGQTAALSSCIPVRVYGINGF